MSASRRIVVGDVGGTHARFAFAELGAGLPRLGEIRKYRTADYRGLAEAWQAFTRDTDTPLPDAAAIAVAVAVQGDVLRFPNSGWVIDRQRIGAALGVRELLLLNDFGAVAHAVAGLSESRLVQLAGPTADANGVTTVIGLGTGLGVAILLERDGSSEIVETEAGHAAFAPQTEEEREIEAAIRGAHGRCSVERVISGPGLEAIYRSLAAEDLAAPELWTTALAGNDPAARRALDILIGAFGSAAGDFSLAHGSMRVVITGSLANRMQEKLANGRFAERFAAKGRYAARQQRVSIWLAREEEPGLIGAALAFERR